MNYNFSNNQPIYLQIVRQLEREIISGARSPGDRVESVRELAIKIKVNPNTVQRALTELENKEISETERTKGRFVTKNKTKILKLRDKYFHQKTEEYLKEMKNLKIDKQEIINQIKENY